ncbi:MAG: DUF4190 domain-containing protein [Actinobacteria bacterium]|nr:DUF4190 domain-containing protein [Actinomycetota bacterium]
MNNNIKSEKYRKLSISALITGILAYTLGGPLIFSPPIYSILISIFGKSIDLIFPMVIGLLSITAVICGSIDLKRIKAGSYSNKGSGFDIAGIVLGGIFILFGFTGFILFFIRFWL